MVRDFEREILPMAQHFGLALAPWDCVGGGRLQSKKQVRVRQANQRRITNGMRKLEERKKQGEKIRTLVAGEEQTELEVKYSEVLSKIADEHQVDSVTVIALAYVLQKAPYVFPIVGEWSPLGSPSGI